MEKLSRIEKEFQILKPFINKYNWKGINYPSKIGDLEKTFEKNNPTIALNILYIKEKGIYLAYILK